MIEFSNAETEVPQWSISGRFFFNIFMCDLLFDVIDVDLANYVDYTTPHAYDLELDEVIKSLKKYIDKSFN